MPFPIVALIAALLGGIAPPAGLAQLPEGPSHLDDASSSGQSEAGGLRVFVVTFGPSAPLLSRFGHSSIWVEDSATGVTTGYNYGLSNTGAPGFRRELVRGAVMSRPSRGDPKQMMESYAAGNRTIVSQELNLTEGQARALHERLESDVGPEGQPYVHDFYRANCSTGVRDVLDWVLDGQLSAQTHGIAVLETYRSESLRYASADPLLYLALVLGMGRSVDHPLTAWEVMFLPSNLREGLRRVAVRNERGGESPLVLEEVVLYRASPEWTPASPWWRWPAALLIGGLSGLALLLLGTRAPHSRWSRWSFALLSGTWLIVIGTGGLAVVGLWVFTGQQLAYQNENVLLVHPLALIAGWLIITGALSSPQERKVLRWMAACMALAASLTVLIKPASIGFQANGTLIALLVPGYLAMAWALVRWDRAEHRSLAALGQREVQVDAVA